MGWSNRVRRRNVRQNRGPPGRKTDLLWRSRMGLLRRLERLTDRQQQRLFNGGSGLAEGWWCKASSSARQTRPAEAGIRRPLLVRGG